jgi:hypothetical protein
MFSLPTTTSLTTSSDNDTTSFVDIIESITHNSSSDVCDLNCVDCNCGVDVDDTEIDHENEYEHENLDDLETRRRSGTADTDVTCDSLFCELSTPIKTQEFVDSNSHVLSACDDEL